MYKLLVYLSSLLLMACSTPPLTVQLLAAPQLNSTASHETLPVEVKLYQLTRAELFNTATFNQLQRDEKAVLKDSLVASRNTIVAPRQHKTVSWQRQPRAQYLAVVVLFQRRVQLTWRQIVKLPPAVVTDIVPLRFKLSRQQLELA